VDFIADANQLTRAFRRFAFGPDCPEPLAERLQLLPGSQADIVCEGAELLWANRAQLPPAGLEVMGQMFAFAAGQNWSAFNAEQRCERIVAAVRRDLGEPGDWPDPDTDPAPLPGRTIAQEEPLEP
jgi:hypothetical protein